MALTTAQQQWIMTFDNEAKHLLQQGDEAALLMSLCDKMDKIKEIMDASTHEELNDYCQQYDGFYQYMKLMEKMAYAVSQGKFDDVLK